MDDPVSASSAGLLRALELRPNKKLGQNFLCDPLLAEELVSRAQLLPQMGLIEIGPGLGALTEVLSKDYLSPEGGSASIPWLYAIELDAKLVRHLQEKFAQAPHLKIIQADILALDLNAVLPQKTEFQVIGNLPYSISTEIFFSLLRYRERMAQLSVMVQREVAERLTAQPGTKAYGRLSILPQIFFDIEAVFEISGTSFFPRTKVDSTFLVLRRREKPLVADLQREDFHRTFNEITAAIFKWRRKNLKNSLIHLRTYSGSTWEAILEQANLDGRRRGETLSFAEWRA